MSDFQNRRTFLRAAVAAGAAWATVDLAQVEEALAWASHQAAQEDGSLSALTRAQADVVDAVASRILPSIDGRPGAHEAGVVYFVDRALASFNAVQKKLYVDGITDLNRRAAARWKGAAGFTALTAPQQDELLRQVEKTPFFEAARFDTIVGAFALPTRGGNRNYAGWHMLGFDHQPVFQPPFGYYDAEINKKG